LTDFKGRRIVITGAGGGVGRALTSVFGELGADIVACDVEGADISGPNVVHTHHFDFRNRPAVTASAKEILSGGTPSIVVLNAGWTRQETLPQTTADGLVDEMELNFTNVALFCHSLLPQMRAANGDRAFVFVSSVNALSHHGNPAYSAAKAAGLAWMRALAVEEGVHGIRANAVVPGSIRTSAWDHRLQEDPQLLDRVSALYPLGRIVTAREVANTAMFLASPNASGITGTALNVDAGLMAGNLKFLDGLK
jgi:NAD(P)-dependent dehydrogenase (short-subunit alcohol dehydrogenase family)